MGYYNIPLTDAKNKVCMITTSFGKYEYNCIPIGFCTVPKIFQEKMGALMDDLEFVRVYYEILIVIVLVSF